MSRPAPLAPAAIDTRDGGPLTHGPFRLTRTGLSVAGRPSFDEWEQCGAFLKDIEGAVQWWIGDWVNYGEQAYGEKYSQALAVTSTPQATLEQYAFTARNIRKLRRRKNLSFAVHSEIARLPTTKDQDNWLRRADDEQMTRAALRTALRLAKRKAHAAEGALPDGVFRVFYADPPWAYDDSGVIVAGDAYGCAERHYPTMTIDELVALPVVEHVADDAVLFLWVTSPLLSACWPVIEAWGFTYKTSLVWDKVAHNFGHYVFGASSASVDLHAWILHAGPTDADAGQRRHDPSVGPTQRETRGVPCLDQPALSPRATAGALWPSRDGRVDGVRQPMARRSLFDQSDTTHVGLEISGLRRMRIVR